MEKISTALPDVWELRPTVIRDSRGSFMETYQQQRFADLGIRDSFVQDNHSLSTKGTLRGLHFQNPHQQAKLCRVVEGEALDVVVDVRRGSPYFGKSATVRLSAATGNQIYIPPGFAHGFLALSNTLQFLYKCSDFYVREAERGIAWNDPALHIEWSIATPLLSEKDSNLPRLAEIPPEHLPVYIPR